MFRPLLVVLGCSAVILVGGLAAIVGLAPESGTDSAPPPQRISRPIVLELPVECSFPDRCAVQFHVDRQSGLAVGDFRCGRLSYDTHRGTDFRVFAKEDFIAGVPVLAAAAGRVAAIRDGMDDVDVGELGRGKVEGRAGGNQVVIEHDNGWETYYWHLRKGSIAVQQGQVVAAGARLGFVGLSGDTNFPHLHFELRRNRNIVIDPFDASAGDRDCRVTPQSLWTESAMERLVHQPMVARLGFATRDVSRADAIYGRTDDALPRHSPPALFVWMEIYGLARNDQVSVQWGLPDGSWRNPAQFAWQDDLPYAFRTGKLNLPAPLPAGTYSARLKITRGDSDAIVFEKTSSVKID